MNGPKSDFEHPHDETKQKKEAKYKLHTALKGLKGIMVSVFILSPGLEEKGTFFFPAQRSDLLSQTMQPDPHTGYSCPDLGFFWQNFYIINIFMVTSSVILVGGENTCSTFIVVDCVCSRNIISP